MKYEHLRPYATARQAEVLDALEDGSTINQAADKLGIAERRVYKNLERLKRNAAKQGYSPENDMNNPVPDGFIVSGVSTYYNDEGQPVGQWVKSQADTQALFEQALEDFKQGLVEDVQGKAKPVDKPTDNKDKNLAACYLIGDHHLGMRAWNKETGQDDYDIDISCKLLLVLF